MFSLPHAAIGLIIVKTVDVFVPNTGISFLWQDLTFWLIAAPLSALSHLLLDNINENGLKLKEQTNYDAIPHLLLYVFAIFTGNLLYFAKGSITGNLPDIVDKKFYIAILYRRIPKLKLFLDSIIAKGNKLSKVVKYMTEFSYYMHSKKPPIINPKPLTTKIIGIVSMILIIIIML
jgi:hypothetical protein